ncbi:MAG: rRNA maturation RNase YbeY [Thiolinea sp.]
MTLLIEIQNPQNYTDIPDFTELDLWASACWLDENDAGVVIRVVDEQESRDLNRGFRGKDYPTNILSFQYENMAMLAEYDVQADSDIDYLGDLVICKPVIAREAAEQGKEYLQHWAHMLVHGLLHLQGFDHIREIEADIMEAREIEILRGLGFPNPYEPD